ncbi:MAG: RnfABCDGE type electron transport complex subunit D [Treponema sp.]|jgi:electron transport complex protein RnfD|nr:RnfABCDGE type electron transport complex subunit D [Treponema sp.]
MADNKEPLRTDKKTGIPLLLSSSPHIVSPVNTSVLMGNMLAALAPSAVFGVVLFGVPALLTILVSVASAAAAEALFRLAARREVRVRDLSAAVTGLLLALILPPSMPLWMTALGAVFAVIVAKEFFGGLGGNVFNPALIGRAFLLMSFPAAMTKWHFSPGPFPLRLTDAMSSATLVDGVSGVTPLGIVKAGSGVSGLGRVLLQAHISPSDSWGSTMKALFIGWHPGSIGESPAWLILAAFAFLLIRRTIDWRAPAGMIAAAFVSSFVLGLDPLFSVLSGGLLFGAVFMATDYVTAPLTAAGKLIFGIGAGIISILIRKWGTYPEGVSYGILIMNGFTPFLNKLLPRKYGFVPKKKAAAPPQTAPAVPAAPPSGVSASAPGTAAAPAAPDAKERPHE